MAPTLQRFILACRMCRDDPLASELVDMTAQSVRAASHEHCFDRHLVAYMRDLSIAEDEVTVRASWPPRPAEPA